MFTGIVEHIGVVADLKPLDESASGGNGTSITIAEAGPILVDCQLGDSIAVNGVCLTVTEFEFEPSSSPPSPTASTGHTTNAPDGGPSSLKRTGYFKIGVAPETLRRTNLGSFRLGTRVNLERAAMATPRKGNTTTITTTTRTPVPGGTGQHREETKTVTIHTGGGTRIGGHNVQGHVDTVAIVEKLERDGNSLRMRFRPRRLGALDDQPAAKGARSGAEAVTRSVLRHIIEKGYIALDGTSLTITQVCDYDPLSAERKEELRAQAVAHAKRAHSVSQPSSSASASQPSPVPATAAELVRAVQSDVDNLDDGWFEVMLIAYTQEKVIQATKEVGEWVNVEVDMAAKYIDKSVQAYFNAAEREGGAGGGGGESGGKDGHPTDGMVHFPVLEKLVSRLVDQRMAELQRQQGQ